MLYFMLYFALLQLATSFQTQRIGPNIVTYRNKLDDVKVKLDLDQLYYNQYD